MAETKSQKLPVLPLPQGLVLLPGATVRIPVDSRPDIRALFSAASIRSKTPRFRIEGFLIGCVPLRSDLLNTDGQKLITGEADESTNNPHETAGIDPAQARRRDLFGFGTSAKVRKAYGRSKEEAVLEVEGVQRFKLERFTQKKPFFEAEVKYIEDGGTE